MNDYDRGSKDTPIKPSILTAEDRDAQLAEVFKLYDGGTLIPLHIAFRDIGVRTVDHGSEELSQKAQNQSRSSLVRNTLPTDHAERKGIPIVTGVLDYFPAAIAEIAKVSKAGNDQHNLGEPLHWARGKSTDQADTIARHLLERGTIDSDGQRHSAKMAWRALALLQLELEEAGAPRARGAY